MLLALTLSLAGLAEGMNGLTLGWQAPAGCPDAAMVRGRVVSMVGEEAAARADVQAMATVRAEAGRWQLELELRGAGGSDRRTLVDGECGALADAAALMIAVAIDPQARAVPEDSPPENVVPAPPGGDRPEDGAATVPVVPMVDVPMVPPTVPAVAPVVVEPAVTEPDVPVLEDRPGPARARRISLGLRLGAGLGFARILPGVHAALDLALGVEGRLWRVELGGVFVPPVRGTAATDPSIGGRFRLGAGEVRGCGLPRMKRAPVTFPLCLGFQVGAMHGQGEGAGLEVRSEARALWVALRPGAAVRWRPRGGRVGLWLGLDAIVALTRPSFITANNVTVHAAARVGGQASVGVEVRLR